MTDPRVEKLAQVLVGYSLDLQPGEELAIKTNPLADELNLAVYKEALKAGAHPIFLNQVPGMTEIFFKYASEKQLDYISDIDRIVHERYQAILLIEAEYNTRELSGANPASMSRRRKARASLFTTQIRRVANKELKWCMTVFPTRASAQEADMSLGDYEDFVYAAGYLDLPEPITAWKQQLDLQQRLISWLNGKDEVRIKGSDIDLRLSVQGRKFRESSGRLNFPDGEIYTSPVEESVNGWVRFAYPAIYDGHEVVDVELWFEGGKIVKEQATKAADFLTATLNTDQGSRHLGEFGIGTNYAIPRFTKNMLFDEKLGGTIHLAVGLGFPEVGGKNESGVHWDMLCDMSDSEIRFDGELFYNDGKFVVGS
jgi:aminopeptidase